MKASDLFTIGPGTDASLIPILDDYFDPFIIPNEKGKCATCETIQGGIMASLVGGFEWGLVHGEGQCSECGHPGRAYHEVKDEDGTVLLILKMILQYRKRGTRDRSQAAAPDPENPTP